MSTMHLYYHGGSANHGCEAIVRSTSKLLASDLTLYTSEISSDRRYGLGDLVALSDDTNCPAPKPSLKWFASAVHHKLTHTDYLHVKYAHNAFFSQIKRGDVCLSIGGDNYCYAGQDILGYYNRVLQQKGAKTVLWGCSVEPELLEKADIAKDIAHYDLIVARETISYEALKKINPNTLLAPDPAFFLDPVKLPLPDGFVPDNTVGINISPLIMKSESQDGITFESYRRLIARVLAETDMSIALIPHVVEPGNDDREPLQALYDAFSDSGRMVMIADHGAGQLKGFIARCRFFIGARTHATIAAYSSGVPTLAVGYSVKAKGIARDLLGTESNYVLPVQAIEDPEALARAFEWIVEHEQKISAHLQNILPAYKDGMGAAVGAIRSLCKK